MPIWFRVVMGSILAVVSTALAMGDSRPGFLGWAIFFVLCLGFLYEDKWIFDASGNLVIHRGGLLFASRSSKIEFSAIERFCIVPLVRGTIPGTEDEKIENAAALRGHRADERSYKHSRHKKHFLSLSMECCDGSRYLIDHVPARRAEALRIVAARIATLCDKPVSGN
jgi:hypothetical protein